jgi:hypothetical protein
MDWRHAVTRGAKLGIVVCVLAHASGCGRSGPAPRTAAVPTPAFSISSVRRQVHFAFRESAEGWSGDDERYSVRVRSTGAFTLAARDRAAGRESRAATFETVSVGRDRASRAAGQIARRPDGGLEIARGDVVEHLRNEPAGVAQSWAFAGRPAGRGDLVVRVRVGGLELAAEDADGLHFRDTASGLGLRYGHGTWIDAKGLRTPIAVAREGDELRLRVPAAVVDGASYPAVLDPVISPEREIGVEIVGTSPEWQEGAAVAWDGARWVVAWADRRSLGNYDVYAARVAPDGSLLDPAGIQLSRYNDTVAPAVACDGAGKCLVAWSYTADQSVRGVVLDPSGHASPGLDVTPPGFAIGSGSDPTVGYAGGRFLVAWSSSSGVSAAWVSGKADAAFPIASGATAPSVACDPAACGVAVSQGGDVRVLRVPIGATAASALYTPGALPGTQGAPALAFDGERYLLAFQDAPADAATSLEVISLTTTGTAVGAPLTIDDGGAAYLPAIAAAGGRAVLAWEYRGTSRDVRASVLTTAPEGTTMTVAPFTVSGGAWNQGAPAVAAGSGSFLIAFADDATNDRRNDVRAALVGAAGDIAKTVLVSASANLQRTPRVAFDGTNYLVVWEDRRNGAADIYAARVARDGTVLDPDGIAVATSSYNEASPEVVFAGGRFVVVSFRFSVSTLVARAIERDGTLLPEKTFPATSSPVTFSLATDGTRALVVGVESGAYVAIPVASDGTPGAKVSLGVGSVFKPAVAGSPDGWLVAWQVQLPDYTNDVMGARLTSDTLIATPITVCEAPGNQFSPAMTFDGTRFVTAWTDDRTFPRRVRAARISTAGAVLDPSGIEATAGRPESASPAAIAFDGSGYVIAYTDWPPAQVLGVQLGPDLAPLDPSGFVVAGGRNSRDTTPPSLACDGGGGCLVVYDRYDTAAGTERVFARVVAAPLSLGAGCSTALECASGACVDGVCCDTLCGGGDPSDCQACSVAAGGSENGRCTPRANGTVCRGAAGLCDAKEACDGASTACPPDGFAAAGTECRPAAGVCDVAETCTGSSAACPPDGFVAAGTECRAAAGICDVAEQCTGASPACPDDASAADGTPCDDHDACTSGDSCSRGSCVPGPPTVCAAPDACHEPGACSPSAGTCVFLEKADGTACPGGACRSGECVPPPAQPDPGGCGCGSGGPATFLALLGVVAAMPRRRSELGRNEKAGGAVAAR